MVALNLNDGRLLWSRQVALPHGASAVERLVDIGSSRWCVTGLFMWSPIKVNWQRSIKIGQPDWQIDMSSHAGLAVDASAVYAVDENSHLWALNRQTGRVLWHQDKLEGRGLTQPVIHNGAVAVGDSEGYLHWLSTQDGPLFSTPFCGFQAPACYSSAL